MALAIPNLFLKWLAFRELLKPPQSNAEIATRIWGPDDGPSKFSKLLRGDYGCEPDVAAELAEVVNKRIAVVRGAKGLDSAPKAPLRGLDFEASAFAFTQRMIEAAEVTDADALDRTHKALIAEFAPTPARASQQPRLAIEQFSTSRFFEGVEAAEDGPPVFEIGHHKGLFAIEGLGPEATGKPVKAYALFTRDPTPAGGRVWDGPFGDTVRWLPSPFVPEVDQERLLLMRQPKPVQAVAGHFHVTVVVVLDPAVIGRLDPRGATPPSASLDEEETARFLTNLNRVAKSHPDSVIHCAGDYLVRERKAA